MKLLIIIAISFVLLVPSTVFAEPEIFTHTEATYKECMSRVNEQVNDMLKQQSQQGSVIGYEDKFQKQLMDNCIVTFLYPLTDAGLKLVEQGKYLDAITYFDKALEIEPKNNDAKWSKAKTLQVMGEHELALSLFEEVAEQSPTQDFSKEIEYSKEQLAFVTSDNICGKGTIEKNGQCVPDSTSKSSKGGGCLIATATYGSELAPQVQQLRELRDNQLLNTELGSTFMGTFNDFYYSFSPIIADYERENPMFREMVKITITPMVSSLSILNYVDMDSESKVLGYGISLIILNGLMYVGIPFSVVIVIRRF